MIDDDGEGIFKKIKNALNLLDEKQAVLELAKGKLTTDPSRHTGEGIFFTSRAFNDIFVYCLAMCFSPIILAMIKIGYWNDTKSS